jgi:hypothetical protein
MRRGLWPVTRRGGPPASRRARLAALTVPREVRKNAQTSQFPGMAAWRLFRSSCMPAAGRALTSNDPPSPFPHLHSEARLWLPLRPHPAASQLQLLPTTRTRPQPVRDAKAPEAVAWTRSALATYTAAEDAAAPFTAANPLIYQTTRSRPRCVPSGRAGCAAGRDLRADAQAAQPGALRPARTSAQISRICTPSPAMLGSLESEQNGGSRIRWDLRGCHAG